jgi:long-chain acyl-CoA synthetase
MNIGSLLSRNARLRRDHLALVFEEERLTWKELEARVNRLANVLLALGLKKGDKLALVLPNSVEFFEAFLAAARQGIVVVPLSPLLRGPALSTLLQDSDSCAVITCAAMMTELDPIRRQLTNIPAQRYLSIDGSPREGYRHYPELTRAASADAPPYVEIAGSDPYNIIYSSGTTGLPKGIIHTHDIRAMYGTHLASSFRMTPESVVLHGGSLVFNGAWVMLMPWLYLGATYVAMPRFEAASFIDLIRRERATHMMMVPSQIIAMMGAPNFSAENLQSIEALCTVGAPLHTRHKEKLAAAIPGVFYELYGLTEGFVTILDKNDYASKPGSVGCPPPFFEMRICDDKGNDLPPGEVGEIVGRGPLLMPGYYKRPDLTAQAIVDGWLHTGDLGHADVDGFLHLVDRKKDLIISGGVNIYPKDIEEIVVQHPAVRESAVFGVPDEKWGEVPVAAVILVEQETVEASEIRAWVNARVAARYQQVKDVVIMADFPRSTPGKTLKRVMREPYWSATNTAI